MILRYFNKFLFVFITFEEYKRNQYNNKNYKDKIKFTFFSFYTLKKARRPLKHL